VKKIFLLLIFILGFWIFPSSAQAGQASDDLSDVYGEIGTFGNDFSSVFDSAPDSNFPADANFIEEEESIENKF